MSNTLIYQYYRRNIKLKKSGYDTYQDFLKSDIWKLTKEKIKERAKWQEFWNACWCCGIKNVYLVAHHRKYKAFDKVKLSSLVPVCFDCHTEIHTYHKEHPDISIKTATKRIKRNHC